jgi:hypothetical protein
MNNFLQNIGNNVRNKPHDEISKKALIFYIIFFSINTTYGSAE